MGFQCHMIICFTWYLWLWILGSERMIVFQANISW